MAESDETSLEREWAIFPDFEDFFEVVPDDKGPTMTNEILKLENGEGVWVNFRRPLNSSHDYLEITLCEDTNNESANIENTTNGTMTNYKCPFSREHGGDFIKYFRDRNGNLIGKMELVPGIEVQQIYLTFKKDLKTPDNLLNLSLMGRAEGLELSPAYLKVQLVEASVESSEQKFQPEVPGQLKKEEEEESQEVFEDTDMDLPCLMSGNDKV